MKKTGRKVGFLGLTVIMLVLFLGIPVSQKRLHSTKVHAQEQNKQNSLDGVYTIEGRLWHATMNQPSMGNAAVTQPMKMIKNGDSVMLQMEFHSLTSGVFAGYLYSLHYFPSWTDESEVPKGAEPVSVTVTEYYDGIYDDYNHPSAGLDKDIRGKFYPHYAVMPIQWNAAVTWVQVYVPVMETISAGSGRQYARLQLDWSTLKKTEEKAEEIPTSPAEVSSGSANSSASASPSNGGTSNNTTSNNTTSNNTTSNNTTADNTTSSEKENNDTANSSGNSSGTENKKLKISSLEDGTYTITGEMLKPDKKNKSMSNEAIDHNITLTVKKGKYSLTVNFSGLTVGKSKGYLNQLKYFKTGYEKDKNGVPMGTKAAVTIKEYQKDSSGKKLSDSYGTNYPAKVTFPMIAEAQKDGYVPLQVFVPIMEAISEGTGTQPVYLKLDLSSITAEKKNTGNNAKKNTSEKKSNSQSGKNVETSSQTSTKSNQATMAEPVSNTENTIKGTVYSCQVVPCYEHPVTGKIEDSGGTSSYATGQGMVESVLGDWGMLEETENGEYYLTVRMSLMDMTSGHEFWVQKRGESGWKSVSAVVTQNGSDKNGKTSDYCFPVPDKDSIIKVSMFVEPMGRDVVFYAYLDNLKKGQPEDMKATKVWADAVNADNSAEETEENETEEKESEGNHQDGIDKSNVSLSDTGLSSAQGLSLSTKGEVLPNENGAGSTEKDAVGTTGGNGEMSFGKWVLVLTFSLTISGLLLMAAGAGLVYYFRRNWYRWGEEMVDDED